MPSMSVEPAELAELLATCHVRLSEMEQHLLAARCSGGSNEDVALVLGYSPNSLRPVFERIQDVVLRPLGLERNLGYITCWFNGHVDCEKACLAHAKMLIEKRIVYAIG